MRCATQQQRPRSGRLANIASGGNNTKAWDSKRSSQTTGPNKSTSFTRFYYIYAVGCQLSRSGQHLCGGPATFDMHSASPRSRAESACHFTIPKSAHRPPRGAAERDNYVAGRGQYRLNPRGQILGDTDGM
jgi:hypothetical protein